MSRKPAGRNTGVLRMYRSYNVVDKDPGIDKLRTAKGRMSLNHVSILSGVSVACLDGWFNGKTRRPQHATMAAVAGALGYEWQLAHIKEIDFDTELPKARKWIEERNAKLKELKAKKR